MDINMAALPVSVPNLFWTFNAACFGHLILILIFLFSNASRKCCFVSHCNVGQKQQLSQGCTYDHHGVATASEPPTLSSSFESSSPAAQPYALTQLVFAIGSTLAAWHLRS